MSRWLPVAGGLIAVLVGWGRPATASTASLYFSPSATSVTVGSSLMVTLKMNTGGQPANASEATISFPSAKLQLTSVSKTGSVFTYWAVEPSGNTTSSQITFSGGVPSPGYTGTAGTILSMTFQAKTSGIADLSLSGAKILANDGGGTDNLSDSGTASITINDARQSTSTASPTTLNPLVVSSPTFPNQSAWYQSEQGVINWTVPTGATGYSWVVSQDAAADPDHTVDTTGTTTVVTLSADGQWYFALQAQQTSGWSTTARYRIQRDRTAPNDFRVSVMRDRGATDPSPQLEFSATDATSGIDHYTLSIDGAPAVTTASPATLNDLTSGAHSAVVTAIDRAGNLTASTVSVDQTGYPAPIMSMVSSPLLLLERLVVQGLALAGDTVTVYVDGHAVGQVVAGRVDQSALASGITVRTSWSLATDRVFRPGHYQVRAVAVSSDGQTSVASDPVPLIVSGHSIMIGGRIVATVAFGPLISLVLLGVAALITWVMIQLLLSVKRMHDRDVQVEDEVEDLRRKVRRQQVSNLQVDESLELIEQDLERPLKSRTGKRRSPRRR